MTSPSAFPLRLRSPRLRELVREIAEREHVSQNEFIEQAIEREVIARGALLAEELMSASARITELTDAQYATIVARSVKVFVAGEMGRDPLQATALHSVDGMPIESVSPPARPDSLGVLAAFEAARA